MDTLLLVLIIIIMPNVGASFPFMVEPKIFKRYLMEVPKIRWAPEGLARECRIFTEEKYILECEEAIIIRSWINFHFQSNKLANGDFSTYQREMDSYQNECGKIGKDWNSWFARKCANRFHSFNGQQLEYMKPFILTLLESN